MIYDREIECGSAEQLKTVQATALRKYLEEVGQAIPEYRQRISAAHLDELPKVTDDHELLRRFSSVGFTDAAAYVSTDGSALRLIDRSLYYLETTSGTTSVPKSRYVNWEDDMLDQELVARSFCAFDVKPDDRVLTIDLGELNFHALITKGIARLGIYDSVFYSARRPFGDSMKEALSCSPDVLVTTPSILLRSLPGLAESLNATRSLRKLVYYCEPLDTRLQHYLSDHFGIESFSLYSAIETGIIGAECGAHNGIHVWADVLLPTISEAVPIQSEIFRTEGYQVFEGALGLTTLMHRGKPTLAYLLGDRVQYTAAPCDCGRTLPRVHFVERDNDIFSIFGTKFTYRQIYESVYQNDEITSFLQIVLEDNTDGTTMTLVLPQVESVPNETRAEDLTSELASSTGLSYLVDHQVLDFEFKFVPSEFFTKRKIRLIEDLRSKSLET